MNCLDDFFDAIYILGYTRESGRMLGMVSELTSVGIGDRSKVSVVWNYPSPLDSLIAKHVRLSTASRYVNVILGHYRILKGALELGKNKVLVLEDDARFIKNRVILYDGVSSLPRDFNVAMLDHHWAGGTNHKKGQVNDFWSRCMDRRVSSAAYALDEAGIRWMVDNYERCFVPKGTWLKCCDQYFNVNLMPSDFNFYIATPHLCIQKPIGKRVTEENDTESIYRKMGVSTEDYGDA